MMPCNANQSSALSVVSGGGLVLSANGTVEGNY